MIKAGETAEPLDDTHVVLQRRDAYRFGSDAVSLYKFARDAGRMRKESHVLDLCSGCGIIGLLAAIETGARVTGVELDTVLWDMSVRSAMLNGLDNAAFINADLKAYAPEARFDIVVCNPPFYKSDSKPSGVSPAANSELTVTFDDAAACAARSLKSNGCFFVVHTCSRLDEVLGVCGRRKLMPKDLVINRNCKTFMLKCVKGGKAGLAVRIEEF